MAPTHTDKHWYIFRHGLATHSKRGYGDQIYSAQVLPEGIPPVQRLARYLTSVPYTWGVRSEFLRCEQTAAIVTEITGRAFVTDARLNERVDEPFEVARDRVWGFVEAAQTLPYEHIWVCTHGFVIAALKSFLVHGTFARKDENDYVQPGELLTVSPAGVEVFKFDTVL